MKPHSLLNPFSLFKKTSANRGFTLIQVMVSLALLSVVAMILFQFMGSATRFMAEAEKTATVSESVSLLRKTLAINGACTRNLGNRGVQLNNPIPFGIQNYVRRTNTLFGAPIVSIGKEEKNVRVTDLRLTPILTLGDATKLVNLEVTYQTIGTYSDTYVRKLPLKVHMNGSVVEECVLDSDAGKLTYDLICATVNNGVLNKVDDNGNCIMNGGQWTTGTNSEALCPTGAVLPAGATGKDNCNVILPAGFVDPFPTIQVQMGDGSFITVQRQPFRLLLDVAAKKCTCDWATDLPVGSYAGAQCQIYCIPQ